jgi:hypothetical protein
MAARRRSTVGVGELAASAAVSHTVASETANVSFGPVAMTARSPPHRLPLVRHASAQAVEAEHRSDRLLADGRRVDLRPASPIAGARSRSRSCRGSRADPTSRCG